MGPVGKKKVKIWLDWHSYGVDIQYILSNSESEQRRTKHCLHLDTEFPNSIF
jgi:hypothetical protein